MDNSQLVAIEKFAKGLTECFDSRLKGIPEEASIVRSTLTTAKEIVVLHLQIAQLEYDSEMDKMETEHYKHREEPKENIE